MAPPGSDKSNSPGKSIISGCLSGAIEIMITYPTEYTKTQLQLADKTGQARFSGPIDVVKKTLSEKGPLGLYRGLSPLLYFSIPKNAIRFAAFEYIKSVFQAGTARSLTKTEAFIAGMGAGVCEAVGAVTPMETIKVKFIHDQLISEKPRFKGFFHGIYTISNESGISGIYKGVIPTILKQSTNQGIRFVTYQEIMKYLRKPDEKITPIWKTLLGGAIAGAASVFGNTPIDVVKTRLQGLESHKYRGVIHCVTSIIRDEGLLAFYKGTTPRLARVCLDVAIVFTIYDKIISLLDQLW